MAAATISPAVGVVQTVVFYLKGQFTTTDLTAIAKWLTAQKVKVLAVSGVARAKGGTHVSSVFAVKQGTNAIASLDIGAVAAGTRVDGTVSSTYAAVAKGVEVSIDFTEASGTTPTLDDVSIQVDYIAVH